MTELEKAARQALGALDGIEALLSSMDVTHLLVYGEVNEAITALRRALEQPAQDGGACPTCGAWHDDQIIKQPAQGESK